ncbi:hypothetical protein Tco_0324174 [Tanacetum coccineum]
MLERTRIKDRRCRMIQKKLTLKEYVEVISNSEEVINVIPLAVKSPIVSWNPYCKGGVGYYEIHKADGSYKTYIFYSEMLNDFDREDLIVLYRLLNEKYASTRPCFDNLMLWGDLKIMFEPDSDVEVWKNHQHQELIEWKLYDSCEVHSLMLGEVYKVSTSEVEECFEESSQKENEVNALKKTGQQLNAEILHEHEIEKSFKLQLKDVQINHVQAVDASLMQEGKLDMGKALDAGLVVTESSRTKSDKQNTSSKVGNYTTHAVNADIRLVND